MATWLVTGCSTGLGRGIARAALEAGENVVLTARRPETLRDLAERYPDRATACRLDLNDAESMEQAVETAERDFGGIDVLVNNAGHGYRAAVEESEPEAVEELFETNFFAPARLIQLALPGMRERRRGVIVNVSSIGAVRGALGNGYYGASKAALELLTEALAQEVAGFDIRTLIVEPGAFATAFYGTGLGRTAHAIDAYDALAKRYRAEFVDPHAPRLGDPDAGGRAVVETVLGDEMPRRLLLGSDSVEAARKALEGRLAELETWRHVSVKSDSKQA